MRLFRLFLLGLASIYPLYWTAQFLLFFVPPALRSVLYREPLVVLNISYLQATAVSGAANERAFSWEAVAMALVASWLIWYLRGDSFLTGGMGIAVLGQSALMPFMGEMIATRRTAAEQALGAAIAFGLICFGLHRILRRVGGADFTDRFALLSLLALLPQATLWILFRAAYPNFGTRFFLMLLVPMYLGALVASVLPARLAQAGLANVPLLEITAGFALGCLLFAGIHFTDRNSAKQRITAEVTVGIVHRS